MNNIKSVLIQVAYVQDTGRECVYNQAKFNDVTLGIRHSKKVLTVNTHSNEVSEPLVAYFQNATEPSVAVDARYLQPLTTAGQKLTPVIIPVWMTKVATYKRNLNKLVKE